MNPLLRLKNIATVHLPLLLKVEAKRRFPSLYDRIPIRPSAAWLNPTDNCNMRCIMCNQWRVTKTDELTTVEWKDAITQLHAEGIRKVGFNGGEPLLRKDMPELVAHVGSLAMSSAVITSGFLLDEARMDAFLDAGLNHIMVSIDGVGAEYEKIRNREWGRVEKAARIVSRRFKEGRIDACIGFVVMKETLGHLAGVRAFCQELGLPLMLSLVDSTPFFFKLPENQRSNAHTNWVTEADRPALRELQRTLVEMKERDHHSVLNTYSDIDYMSAYFKDPLQRDIPCSVAQLRVMINSHGEVFGGCWSMASYGCLRKQSLREILSSKRFQAAHKAMFYKKCPGCSCGFATNIRYSMPLQFRDRLYNLLPPLRKRIGSGRG